MRIAAIQCAPIEDDADRSIPAIVAHLTAAEAAAVDLLLLPEAFLLGHSYDPAVIRSRADRADAVLERLCRATADCGTTLIVGAFAPERGEVRNRAFVIARGRIAGRADKAFPNEPGIVAGTTAPVFDHAGTRYGIAICNDANHALPASRLAEAGATLILYPLNNLLPPATAARWRMRSMDNLVARARQTGCWIASSDVVGRVEGRVSFGCTAIVSPDGRVVARVAEREPGVVMHDIA